MDCNQGKKLKYPNIFHIFPKSLCFPHVLKMTLVNPRKRKGDELITTYNWSRGVDQGIWEYKIKNLGISVFLPCIFITYKALKVKRFSSRNVSFSVKKLKQKSVFFFSILVHLISKVNGMCEKKQDF